MMWKLSRAPGSPRHAWATGKWPRRSFFLSSKTSLQRLRIRQMSLFGWVSSSTRESRIDWRRHSGIFEGRKQDGPQNIRRLGWITGLRFFSPFVLTPTATPLGKPLIYHFFWTGSSNEIRPKDRGDDNPIVPPHYRRGENWTPWHCYYHYSSMATSASGAQTPWAQQSEQNFETFQKSSTYSGFPSFLGTSSSYQYHAVGSPRGRARCGSDVPTGCWPLGCWRQFSCFLALCGPYGVRRYWQGQGCLIPAFSLHVFQQPYQQQSRPDPLQFVGPYARDRRSNYVWSLSLYLWWEKYCHFKVISLNDNLIRKKRKLSASSSCTRFYIFVFSCSCCS